MTEKCIWPITFLTLNCKPANITSDGLLVVKSWGNIQKIILLCKQRGVNVNIKGVFYNLGDHISPNFDHLPPLSGHM